VWLEYALGWLDGGVEIRFKGGEDVPGSDDGGWKELIDSGVWSGQWSILYSSYTSSRIRELPKTANRQDGDDVKLICSGVRSQ